jgi:DNA repair protein RadC
MNATSLRLSIRQWAPEDRPSEKIQKLGAEALTDAELISMLIGSGTAQYSAVDIAQHVMMKFGNNLNSLGKARFDELTGIEGMGTQTASRILAAIELGKRRQIATPELHPDMSTATRIYNFMHPKMMDLEHEEFWILLMNQAYKLIDKRIGIFLLQILGQLQFYGHPSLIIAQVPYTFSQNSINHRVVY